ncbi:hypothetical protein B0T11DRAFT_68262 [Plectosphaerella cucumerina]|uniref:Zn(2)-C6 fungal-type domain-containing protein n=1 Tax=Plectosphaerella cucumerina TaxID=40658 RepID=A0A8K0TQH4_9PEZI|nr:hypothetical protein B0T11DRAFT_68262 [Plectosphaerella cucumerina]
MHRPMHRRRAFVNHLQFTMEKEVEVIRKASHACFRCRARKQGCDRALPHCSRCSLKLRCCDYSLPSCRPTLPLSPRPQLLPTQAYVELGAGGLDLTAWGQAGLMASVWDVSSQSATGEPSDSTFTKKVALVLSEYQVTGHLLIDHYHSSIHDWFPVLDANRFRTHLSNRHEAAISPYVELVCLLLMLVTGKPTRRKSTTQTSRLYITVRALVATLQAQTHPSLLMLQASAILALYECGQGMARQAHMTLSGAVAIAGLLDLQASAEMEEEFLHCKLGLLTLDRMIVLSSIKDTLSLLCPPSSPLSMSVQRHFSDPFVAKASDSGRSTSAERLHATAEALLLAGRILQHVNSSRAGLPVDEGEYNMLTAEAHGLADFLMRHGQGHTWPFCGPIIITLNCMVTMHQERVRRTGAKPGSRESSSLQASRRLAWDTCRIPIHDIKDTSVIPSLSFVCMCCAFRAAAVILEAADDLALPGEVEMLLCALDLFRQRWRVGDTFLPGISGKPVV